MLPDHLRLNLHQIQPPIPPGENKGTQVHVVNVVYAPIPVASLVVPSSTYSPHLPNRLGSHTEEGALGDVPRQAPS